MPHIIIEHSRELETVVADVLKAAHGHVSGCGLFNPQAVKGRSIAFDHAILPEGAKNFMHITVAILSGRSEEERAALSQEVFALAKQHAPQADKLSVDIRDMAAATYTK